MPIQREFKIIKQNFVNSVNSARGKKSLVESIVLREFDESFGWKYGEVVLTPGFNKFTLSEVIEEAECWRKNENQIQNSYNFIEPAVSCIKSSIWNCENNASIIYPAKLANNFEDFDFAHRTVKKKIGITNHVSEIKLVKDWLSKLDTSVKVRLDANESLDYQALYSWVEALHGNQQIEFIEQPTKGFPCERILNLIKDSNFPVALDEVVVSLGGPQKLLDMGWEGYFVVKPCLLPKWDCLIQFINENYEKIVISTVYESPFGYENVLRLCQFSNLDPGVDRSILSGSILEFENHHKYPLVVPAIPHVELTKLWNDIE